MEPTRRSFLSVAATAIGSSLLAINIPALAKQGNEKRGNTEVQTTPVEDLSQEHGALRRILLIYETSARRLQSRETVDPVLIGKSAKIIHDFIENYHEKLEEEHLFPHFKRTGKLKDLVDTLLAQHRAGRKLTEKISALATATHIKDESSRSKLIESIGSFITMYRPHAAREDTILFPAFKKIVTPKEYDQLGEKFEDKEHQLFGNEGFEGIVTEIAAIEKALGIFDLSSFTPK